MDAWFQLMPGMHITTKSQNLEKKIETKGQKNGSPPVKTTKIDSWRATIPQTQN